MPSACVRTGSASGQIRQTGSVRCAWLCHMSRLSCEPGACLYAHQLPINRQPPESHLNWSNDCGHWTFETPTAFVHAASCAPMTSQITCAPVDAGDGPAQLQSSTECCTLSCSFLRRTCIETGTSTVT